VIRFLHYWSGGTRHHNSCRSAQHSSYLVVAQGAVCLWLTRCWRRQPQPTPTPSCREQKNDKRRGSKEHQPFVVGQTVRVKLDERSHDWRKAEVTVVLPYRSYRVQLEDGTTRRRNARHVRFSAEHFVGFD
jgi:sRNA-binding protein